MQIANPESAGGVFEPSDDVRAFLLERKANGEVLSIPFLLWVTNPHRAIVAGCECRELYDVLGRSVAEAKRYFGEKKTDPTRRPCVCPCMGRFIE